MRARVLLETRIQKPSSPRDPHCPHSAHMDSFRETLRFSCELFFKFLYRDCLTRLCRNGVQRKCLIGIDRKGRNEQDSIHP